MAKRKASDEESTGFEASLTELQEIVQSLEEGAQGLELSLQQFERGIGLLRNCYALLESAEQKIEILTGLDPQEQPVTETFDGTSTLSSSEGASRRRRGTTTPAAPESDPESRQSGGLF